MGPDVRVFQEEFAELTVECSQIPLTLVLACRINCRQRERTHVVSLALTTGLRSAIQIFIEVSNGALPGKLGGGFIITGGCRVIMKSVVRAIINVYLVFDIIFL